MSRHLITTKATLAICHGCQHPILTGIAEGLPVRVDPIPLNPTGALAAILAGRETYVLHFGELVYREESRIRGGAIRGPILAAHQCGTTATPEHRETTTPPEHPTTESEGIPY